MRLRRNPNYKWGPPQYENKGPAHIEEIVWRIVPEETTRLAAVLTGQSQVTQYVPYSGIAQIRANRNLRIEETRRPSGPTSSASRSTRRASTIRWCAARW